MTCCYYTAYSLSFTYGRFVQKLRLIVGGIPLNDFTAKLHDKGFLVRDFCEYWGICRKTYERMTNNTAKYDKLNKLIEGMK